MASRELSNNCWLRRSASRKRRSVLRRAWRCSRFCSSRSMTSNRCWSSSRSITSAAPKRRPSTTANGLSSSSASYCRITGTSLLRRRICLMAIAGVGAVLFILPISRSQLCSCSNFTNASSLSTCCARQGWPDACSILIRRSASERWLFRISNRIVSLLVICPFYCLSNWRGGLNLTIARFS